MQFLRSIGQVFTGVASEDFNLWLAENYPNRSAPKFFEGTFFDAFTHASAEGRLLLVWLHESNHDEENSILCTRTWPDHVVRQEVVSSFVSWAGDTWRFEPHSLKRALRVHALPAVLLLRPLESGTAASSGRTAVEWPQKCFFEVLAVVTGRITPSRLGRALQLVKSTVEQERQAEAQLRDLENLSRQLMRAIVDGQAEAARRVQEAEAQRACEEEERPLFEAIWESKCDLGATEHPPFFSGGLKEAITAAKNQGRAVLLWLFVGGRDGGRIWTSEVVRAFVDEYFLLVPGDAGRWLSAIQLRLVLGLDVPEKLPALVALRPGSLEEVDAAGMLLGDPLAGGPIEFPAGTAFSVLSYRVGLSDDEDEEEIAQFLAEAGDRAVAEAVVREEEWRRRREEAFERQQLRELQDAEFAESLAIDRAEAESACPSADASRPQPVAATEADVAAATLAVAAAEAGTRADAQAKSRARRRHDAAKQLACRPAPTGTTCHIVLRLPRGERFERRFSAGDTLASIYDWADCCEELLQLETREGVDGPMATSTAVPEQFQLCTTFPRRLLVEREASLVALGLCPNAVLVLSPMAVDP